MRLADLSYRIKIPLAITAVIVATELVVAAALVTRAFRDARSDLETSARHLSAVLARSLREPLVRDDLWQAFEVIRTPLMVREAANPLEAIVVLDAEERVFVASDPQRFPALMAADSLPPWLAALARAARAQPGFRLSFEGAGDAPHAGAAGAILAEDDRFLGTVLLSYDTALFYQRIGSTLVELALLTVPGLLLLLPLGWFWGKRMAEPLARLAHTLGRVGREDASRLAAELPAGGRDEIGRLASAARSMLDDLARKQALEQEILASERLAAVGRVAAGLAHEVNNPLGGMLNAIDTLLTHGQPDAFTRRSLGLLSRGLEQIRATVGALLVEARLDSPALTGADWQDLQTLIAPQAAARQQRLDWRVNAAAPLPLPAHQVRQLVLNLLLNAVNAAGAGGRVELAVTHEDGRLAIAVGNSGPPIAPELRGRLFEPFAAASQRDGRRSHGLGLWVCYQIVQQLHGTIAVDSAPGWTTFRVELPVADADAQAATAAEAAPA
ncbi:MAG: HAMP domain-containing histidine kinase [Burkholderiaceae bacterium]|nr:HAMP domain-containing histidine kinase [Burkholderiaceae bacterium]